MQSVEIEEKELQEYRKMGLRTSSSEFDKWLKGGLLNNIDENFLSQVNNYWIENYDRKIDPTLHVAFSNLTGRKDNRLIQEK
ncbi:hypothetical protein CR194_12710 [Salipaludibacillus keqinensis]|uniref:Uncharacterized protein n=1 Tax=Salipaludibacillus keqinensis TaxID=2045207 RepID=A0A323TSV5_9BACI|nr:hypothetical protein [Salipaludibacillus keqinensis]PYZ92525.1 hypothetical protein CR194_12710 [Salipaludibacillus keqinensis]